MGQLAVTPSLLNWGGQKNEKPFRYLTASMSSSGIKGEDNDILDFNSYMKLIGEDRAERTLQQDWAKHKDSEARLLQKQRFDQMVKVKEMEFKKQNDVFDDLMGTLDKAKGNLPLQQLLLEAAGDIISSVGPERGRVLQAQIDAGPGMMVKYNQYRALNPKPKHTVPLKEDPATWAREEFAILDDQDRVSELFSGVKKSPSTHIPLQRFDLGENSFNQVAIRDPGNLSKIDILASGVAGGQIPFGEYVANGGEKGTSQVIDLNGRKARITPITDTITGKSRVEMEYFGKANDPWKDHPQKPMINSLQVDFASGGADKKSETRELYLQLSDWIDVGRSEGEINAGINAMLTSIPNLSVNVVKRKDSKGNLIDTPNWFQAFTGGFDQMSHKDYYVTFIPGKYVSFGEKDGKKRGAYFNSNGYYYDMNGEFIGDVEETLRRLNDD